MSERLALIIEDESDLAMIFSEALQAAGFTTELIYSGDKALERLAAVVPKIVILDLHLPYVDGLQILKSIRADERTANVKVIVASADHLRAEAADPLTDLVLVKPVSFTQLRSLATRLASEL